MARGRGGFIGQDGLNAPDSPTGVSASAGNAQATVSFTAPTDVGGSAITGFRAQSNTGVGASGSSSPITVTGLSNGTSYTFNVWAINAFGYSAPSDASTAVSPFAQGQQEYTTAGSYTWVAPAGVTSVSIVAIGGGGSGGLSRHGGGGSGLGYKNNYSVTPGASYTVVVGASGYISAGNLNGVDGGDSYFVSTSVVKGGGGGGNGAPGTYTGDGGGNGGSGVGSGTNYPNWSGGGGAGGYSGNGGDGSGNATSAGSAGAGGGGGGGGGGNGCAGGGGVGRYGEGSSGAGGAAGGSGSGGGGGSSGTNGSYNVGGVFGGGCGQASSGNQHTGGKGALRIIWPGNVRQFPSTQTGDL